MKLLPLIICFIMTMVCCTSKHADSTSSTCQSVVTDSIEETPIDTSIVKSDNEDFIAFIKRFHTDTVFQSERIAEVVDGFCSDEYAEFAGTPEGDSIIDSKNNYTWVRNKLIPELHYYDRALTDTMFVRTLSIVSDSVMKEHIFIDGSGTSYTLIFKNKNGIWILTTVDSYTL